MTSNTTGARNIAIGHNTLDANTYGSDNTAIGDNALTNNSTSSRRLEVMSESQDGFYLAEQDLKLRGPGDLLGTRQSGEESFRMADLSVHSHLIPKAINRGELLIASEREESKKEIDNLLSLWARKKSEMLRA